MGRLLAAVLATGPVSISASGVAAWAEAVDDPEAEIPGERVLLCPFRAMEGLRVAFVLRDGAVFEFMRFDAPSAFDAR